MATNQLTDTIGIRGQLNNMGVGNERIGFDKNTGYVTIDGQNAIRSGNVQNGTAYANPNDITQQYNTFNTGQQVQSAEQAFLAPQQTANPYDQQVADLLANLTNMTNNQTPVDPYSSPQYAAAQAQVARGAQQAQRQSQEALGGTGLARSSIVTDRAQAIQNDANNYLQTQLVPGIVQQLQAERQNQVSGIYNLLNALSGQQSLVDERTRGEQDRLANVLDYLTGKQTRQEDVAYRTTRDAVEDMRYEEQVAYQKARDEITDERWKLDFDEDVRRFGLNYALQQQQERRMAADAAAGNALARERFDYDKERDAKLDAQKEAERNGGLTPEARKEEASEMAMALRAGDISPEAALRQIDDDLAVGIYSPSDAEFLKAQVERIAPSVAGSAVPTPEQVKESGQVKSDKELDAEAKSKGYPTVDYRTWYKSANGRLAGNDFETWRRLYGPRIEAR